MSACTLKCLELGIETEAVIGGRYALRVWIMKKDFQ